MFCPVYVGCQNVRMSKCVFVVLLWIVFAFFLLFCLQVFKCVCKYGCKYGLFVVLRVLYWFFSEKR